MICETCNELFTQGTGHPHGDYSHHRTIDDLHRAAIAQCQICIQLFRGFLRHYWDTYKPNEKLSDQDEERTMIDEIAAARESCLKRLQHDSWLPNKDHLVSATFFIDSENSVLEELHSWGKVLEFKFSGQHFNTSRNKNAGRLRDHCHFFTIVEPEIVEKNTFTQTYKLVDRHSFAWRRNLVKGWLQNCIQNHPSCCSDNPKWRPNRLLKIIGYGASRLQLIITKLEPPNEPHGPYITLSHCWGKVRFITLTAYTLQQLLEGFDVSILPKTFQDAVEMTAFLGVEYLWIDSLCILQDSTEDWNVESALMGNIYSNSLCNLAATGSADGNGGLSMSGISPLALPLVVKSSHMRWHVHSNRLEDAFLLLDGPLLTRGWIIQERILATRTIHFGSIQLFWECRQYQACETYPGGLPPTMHSIKSNLVDFDALQKTVGVQSQAPNIALREVDLFWSRVIEGYSRCNLTKQDDKLVAISGLARKIQERHKQFDFVAGMLRQSLDNGLLWEVDENHQTKRASRPTTYRVPSWSWASVDAATTLISSVSETISGIVDVVVAPDDDPMGQNVSATVRIEGYLMTVGVRIIHTKHGESLELRINGLWYTENEFVTLKEIRDVDEPFHNLHCLIIKDLKRDHDDWLLFCLFIQPTGAKTGQFQRYGRYTFRSANYNLWQFSDLKDVQNEEWLEYESVGSDKKCIISIV